METLIDHNDRHNVPLSNEKLRQGVSTVMAEKEEEECDTKCNANNLTMDTFIQSPATTNTPRNIANVPNERRISLDILAETIKVFKRLTLQSTINDSADYRPGKMTPKAIQKVIKWYLITLVTERKEKSLILTLPT